MLNSAKPGLLALLVIQFVIPFASLTADDPPEVARIAQTALAAQDADDFEIAVGQWEQIISEYPNADSIGIALYYAGYCHVQLHNHAKAADRLTRAIPKLDPKDDNTIAQSYLYLGFSQAKLGRELASENPTESKQWLTTSTQTFVTLLNRNANFEDADQALFFQGDAFEALGRLDDAAESYAKMLKYNKPVFKLDGLFALGFIRSQQGKYVDAYELFTQFENEGADHASINEVRFRLGETLVELAKAAENRNDTQQISGLLAKATEKFETVYQSKDARWADDARFEQANTLNRLGKFAESAAAYVSVVQIPNSDLADLARVYSGRDYLKAGNRNAALQLLEKATAVPTKYSAEAAHWLSQLHLRSSQNEQAYIVAKEWAAKTEDTAIKVPLLLDQADAAYASKTRRPESRDLYLAITDSFPQHRLAATALYNASFAAMETGKFKDAAILTGRFRKSYGQSKYLPDVLEVEADSFLLGNQPDQAAATLDDLIVQFEGHPKKPIWQLRKGLALYLQKKYQPAIELLTPVVETLDETEKKAEALHWIGSSFYQLGNSTKSIENLQSSFATNKNWRRSDETLLTLSRAFYLAKQPEQAKQVTARMVQSFPDSPLVGEASFRLGEFEYDAKNYQTAIENYIKVLEKFEKSDYAPHAMNGIGWSQIQLNEFTRAAETFTQLQQSFPNHSLAKDVLVGRASAYRQGRQFEKAIADATAYLNSEGPKTKRQEALNELGLSEVAIKDWPAAIKTFDQLLAAEPNSKVADRYHYELAWAHSEMAKTSKSEQDEDATLKHLESKLQHFVSIAEKLPESLFAPESNFHIGQASYKSEDFAAAAKYYQRCIDKCKKPDIKEKAIYRLAWSHYRQREFQNALVSFRQQIQEFPKGEFHADAMFMISESLYENNQHKEALEHYRVAKPVIETSKSVSSSNKLLTTYLHGAQSANLAGEHETAIEFANDLLKLDVGVNTKQDAQMEIGDAYRALKQFDKAVTAYSQASRHPEMTGARSMCMVGEIYFDQKKFTEAINKFKLVWYGYGGDVSTDKVKTWQALAMFEAARCNLVLASVAQNDKSLQQKHLNEAAKQFETLLTKFPNDKMAPEAKKQLASLKQN